MQNYIPARSALECGAPAPLWLQTSIRTSCQDLPRAIFLDKEKDDVIELRLLWLPLGIESACNSSIGIDKGNIWRNHANVFDGIVNLRIFHYTSVKIGKHLFDVLPAYGEISLKGDHVSLLRPESGHLLRIMGVPRIDE